MLWLMLVLLFAGLPIWLAVEESLGMRVRIDGKWVELPWKHRVARGDRDKNGNALRLHPDVKLPRWLRRPPPPETFTADPSEPAPPPA